MTDHPTVKDLVKMGGSKRRDPKAAVILPMPEAILLHQIIMAAPPLGGGYAIESATDARLTLLRDHKFIQQATSGKWLPTQEGVNHMMPTRKPNRHARRVADKILEGVNQAVVDEDSQHRSKMN